MTPKLKDDLLDGGTNGRLYADGESDSQPYRILQMIRISGGGLANSSSARAYVVAQYGARSVVRLSLDEHLEDARLSDEITKKLMEEGKFRVD